MARQVAQSIKYLPHQCEDPSSILNSHVKMTGMENNTCKSFTGEAEIRGSRGLLSRQPHLIDVSRFNE